MEKELAEKIVEAIENNGGEAHVREGYSGRGMYGKSTYGVVVDDGDIVSSIISCANLFVDGYENPIFDFPEKIRSDNMGLGMIYY